VTPKRVLFISGSVGLGHITRDLPMAAALRRAGPDVEIAWLAGPPASQLVREAGETLLPEAADWADETDAMTLTAGQEAARGGRFQLNVVRWFLSIKPKQQKNVEIFRRVTEARPYDLIIGDETYEIAMALRKRVVRTPAPFVMIYDFIGIDPVTRNPFEHLAAYMINRRWAYGYRQAPAVPFTVCFVGAREDIPDRSFGPGLPNRRRWAEERCRFLGYVLRFDPADYTDRRALRARLGYGDEPLVVCAVGGTGFGRELLDLCLSAYPLARQRIPNLRMLLVGGPRLEPGALDHVEGVEVRGYVPDLHEHFAASDLVITQGGGTSTLELTALRRPFLYFPIEGHFEQQLHVAPRLERHGAGVKMGFAGTTPQQLAEAIVAHLGEEVRYAAIPVEGARRMAEVAVELLGEGKQ
jgi:UDP:flavonoid glycosyltransferase YjiC (YdhE family)